MRTHQVAWLLIGVGLAVHLFSGDKVDNVSAGTGTLSKFDNTVLNATGDRLNLGLAIGGVGILILAWREFA